MAKLSYFLGFCALLAPCSAVLAQRVSFNAPMEYGAANGPMAIATGDFNGDGKPDLAIATYGGSVAILLGQGGGIFKPGATVAVANGILESISVGDFNRDGKPDLAVTVEGAGVAILLGKGDGTFQPPTNYSVGPFPQALIAADFNGDRKLDLAVSTSAGVAVMLGNGNGTFRAPVNYARTYGYESVAAGDFNGDGHLDLVATDYSANIVSVLLGNGDGTFGAATNAAAGTGPWAAVVADFNGDGILDLAVNNVSSSPAVSILLGNGNGTFQPPQSYATQGSAAAAPVVADFDRDGNRDLAVPLSTGVAILLGQGDGSFRPPVNYTATEGPLAAGDFNGDQYPDLAVAGNSGAVAILVNTGKGTFPEPTQYMAPGTTGIGQVAVAALNKDGKLDLVITDPPYVSVMLGNGDGTFQPAVNYSAGTLPGAITVADFNGDGIPDLAVTDTSVWILLGNGDGTFQPAVSYPAGPYPIAIAAGDINNDGYTDLVVAGGGAGVPPISVLLGNGDGTFQAPVSIEVGGSPYSLVVGDFNGDGLADIAVANRDPGSVAVLVGKGDGTFQPPVLYGTPDPGGAPDVLAMGDFNLDGKPDLVVENSVANQRYLGVTVLLGNGDGSFQTPTFYPVDLPGVLDWWWGGVAVADFNGDGFPDIAAISRGGTVGVLAGRGDGTFEHARYFGVSISFFLAAGDFTGGGKADLVIAGGSTLSVLTNTTK